VLISPGDDAHRPGRKVSGAERAQNFEIEAGVPLRQLFEQRQPIETLRDRDCQLTEWPRSKGMDFAEVCDQSRASEIFPADLLAFVNGLLRFGFVAFTHDTSPTNGQH
jgi:hypothetical protein